MPKKTSDSGPPSTRGPKTLSDVIGDIAIVKPPAGGPGEKRAAAEALMLSMKNVKCVFEQSGGIEGEFRLRKLGHLAGENRTLTVHRENGCAFKVDVAKCYFSPRLSTERQRLAEEVGPGESVLNMFAGVGPFSVALAKKEAAVTSCDANLYACVLHEENSRANRVSSSIEVLNADAACLPGMLRERFDRVLMPHPSASDRYLSAALALVKRSGRVHYYRHVLGRDEAEAEKALKSELKRLLPAGFTSSTRRVREVGPRWVEMVAEIHRTG
jgi:tRNA (guanine37-N1)-methyltransferase